MPEDVSGNSEMNPYFVAALSQVGVKSLTGSPTMSRLLVSKYQAEVQRIIDYGGSRNEGSIETAFQNLLTEYCKSKNFVPVPKLEYKTKGGKVVPDGTIKDAIRMAIGNALAKEILADLIHKPKLIWRTLQTLITTALTIASPGDRLIRPFFFYMAFSEICMNSIELSIISPTSFTA